MRWLAFTRLEQAAEGATCHYRSLFKGVSRTAACIRLAYPHPTLPRQPAGGVHIPQLQCFASRPRQKSSPLLHLVGSTASKRNFLMWMGTRRNCPPYATKAASWGGVPIPQPKCFPTMAKWLLLLHLEGRTATKSNPLNEATLQPPCNGMKYKRLQHGGWHLQV